MPGYKFRFALLLAFGLALTNASSEADYEETAFGSLISALREEAESRDLIPDDWYSTEEWAFTLSELSNIINNEVYTGLKRLVPRSPRQDGGSPAGFWQSLIEFLPSVASMLRTGSRFLVAITDFLDDVTRSLVETDATELLQAASNRLAAGDLADSQRVETGNKVSEQQGVEIIALPEGGVVEVGNVSKRRRTSNRIVRRH